MSKVFEDYFSELQADMVSIAVEYVENQAEQVFVYCSFRARVIYGDVFYKINGKVCRKHKVNEALQQLANEGVVAELAEEAEGVLHVELDLNEVVDYRQRSPYLRDRRPDLYDLVLLP